MRIKWLQLSDIHFNYKNYESENLRSDFLARIKQLGESEPFTHLFLTGDILFLNNNPAEDVCCFIDALVSAMNIPLDHVLVVPGNHDHNRSLTERLNNSLLKLDKDDKSKLSRQVDELDSEQIAHYLDSFSNYDQFYNRVFGKPYYSTTDSPHIIECAGDLTVIKLNTAWLETDSDNSGTICCGTRALQQKLISEHTVEDDRFCIALGHHPLDELSADERERVIDLFARNGIDIYLCGHRHQPSIKYYDNDILEIVCPGGYHDGYSTGGYVWGLFDTDSSVYYAEVFNWNNGDWRIESRLPGTDERGIIHINTFRHKHCSDLTAIDIKLFNGHISHADIEQSLGSSGFYIHSYNTPDPTNWEINEKQIVSLSETIAFYLEKNKKVHLYPLAPIPLLIKLGFELQNNSKLFLHQYDRKTAKWVYDGDEDIGLSIGKDIRGNHDLVVKIATSHLIEDSLIKNTLQKNDYDMISFTASHTEFGCPLYIKTIIKFAGLIIENLDEIASNYDRIHLFAAIPAGLAIEIGRRLLKSVYYNVYTYQLQHRKYDLAFIIHPDSECFQRNTVKSDVDNVVFINGFDHNIAFLPLVGSVACGDLSEAITQVDEFFPLSTSILDSGTHFVLRASGDSMIDAGIEDGDLVLVKQQYTAEEGQVVVALVDNSATLKRIHYDRKNKRVILHPENEKYKDMVFDDLSIQGVAKMVIKNIR